MVGDTRKRRSAFAVILAISLATLGSASGPARATAGGNECYQDEAVLEPGPTTVETQGSTRFGHAKMGGSDIGGGTFSWELHGSIMGPNDSATPTNGDIGGALTAHVNFDDPSQTDFTFNTSCVLQLWTAVGFLKPSRYQGTISEGAAARAVPEVAVQVYIAQFSLDRVSPSRANLHFRLTSGDGCQKPVTVLVINRKNATAPGHKTGNGGRKNFCD